FSLILFSPWLAKIALNFSAGELMALAVFGLSIISTISGKNVLKGLLAACLGLLVALIGMDPVTAFPRYTFNTNSLMNGINLIPALIGLFGVSQVLLFIENNNAKVRKVATDFKVKLISIKETLQLSITMIRSG